VLRARGELGALNGLGAPMSHLIGTLLQSSVGGTMKNVPATEVFSAPAVPLAVLATFSVLTFDWVARLCSAILLVFLEATPGDDTGDAGRGGLEKPFATGS